MGALFDPNPAPARSWAAWCYTRGGASVLALAGLLAGVPWALVRFTEWPITGLPTWEQVKDLPTSAASDAAIVGVFVVGLWAGWSVFAACVVLEIVGQVRGSDAVRLPGLGPLQGTARGLVASVVMTVGSLGTSGTPRVLAAADGVPASTPVVATGTTAASHGRPPTAPAAVVESERGAWRWITVADRDTAWDLAERHYGDGAEAQRLWVDNRDQLQPDGSTWANEADPVEPGWRLRLLAESNNEPQPSGEETVTVRPGDNLWTIAEDHLADHLEREPATRETSPYWQATVDTNRQRLTSGDPDLIYPDEMIVLPTPPSITEPQEPEPRPDRPARPPEPSHPGSIPPAETVPPTPSTTSPAPSTTASPSAAPPAPGAHLPPTSNESPPSSTPTDGPELNRTDGENQVEIVVGVSAALAALTLGALARRRLSRRKSVRPGTSTGPRPAADIETEKALAIGAGDALDRAWQAARALKTTLLTMRDPSTVTGLVVQPDGTVVVHLADVVAPSPPFVDHTSEAMAWVLPAEQAGFAAELGEPPPPLETVVALGRTASGEWVFVDLESLGALSIEGHQGTASRLLRSLLAELALQPLAHYVDVTVVGDIEAPEITEQGVVAVEWLDEPLTHEFERLAAETGELLVAEEVASTFAARAQGIPRDGLVATVMVATGGNDPVLVGRLAEAAAPGGRGIAIVTLDPLGPEMPRVVANEDGTLGIPHLGLTVHAAGPDTDELARVDDLLGHEPDTAGDVVAEPVVIAVDPAVPYEPPAWSYCVRVYAHLLVEEPDGAALSFRYGTNPDVPNKNTNRGPELLAYLALRPDRSATVTEVGDHMWWERPISPRSVETLVAGTRKVLGGRDHLSPAEGDPARRRYRLAPTVTTDVELLDHALAYARGVASAAPDVALATLRPHLARIEAPPFHQGHLGGGLKDWATAYRMIDRVDQPVIAAGLLAAELAADQGPQGLIDAQWALDQALRACEINEALIRAAMTIDARLGHREAAQNRYLALATRLTRDDLEPEPETTELRAEIMSPRYRIG